MLMRILDVLGSLSSIVSLIRGVLKDSREKRNGLPVPTKQSVCESEDLEITDVGFIEVCGDDETEDS